MVSALLAALHFVAAFGVAAAVFGEWLTLSRTPTYLDARRIQRCDALYGLSALAVTAAGLLRVYYFEKGSGFYVANPVFLLKIAAFATAGVLSIYPTMRFIGWRTATRAGQAPTLSDREFVLLSRILRLELALLIVMVVCASFMAKGFGLSAT